ncbi:MarR family transcriptional regulator [Tateyamaria sp. ANG-S1]|uniref:MarR family transcriptional regulator n=1 Tax=Tateyamaria sp. ANG-S1 TaxID=1577905 RepID=UPI001269CDE9|nr:MarR family transcriptional regulator [Tateyamaria sp. ANG-S1]
MDTKLLGQIAQLRALLEEMEKDFGMHELSRNERDIVLAFCACIKDSKSDDGMCSTDVVRANPIVKEISQPTFHRTLKQLIKRGLIERCEGFPMGLYRLSDRASGQF